MPVQPTTSAELQATELPLRLVGFDGNRETARALIEHVPSGNQELFSPGGSVFGLATLQRIIQRGVLLREPDGRITRLSFGGGARERAPAGNASSITALTGTDVLATHDAGPLAIAPEREAEGASSQPTGEFSADEIRTIAEHPGLVIAQTSPVLAMRDGKIVGVQFSLVDQDSAPYRAGFRSGDILLSIDGTRVTDPYDIAKVLLEIGKTEAHFLVEREGKPVRLTARNTMH